MTTAWLNFASSMATPRPMPRPAPVTRETGRSFMSGLRGGYILFGRAILPLARPGGQRIFGIRLHARRRRAAAQRLQRLVERLDEEVFAEQDGLVNAQVFVDVVDAAVQNTLESGRQTAQIFVGERAERCQREVAVGARPHAVGRDVGQVEQS